MAIDTNGVRSFNTLAPRFKFAPGECGPHHSHEVKTLPCGLPIQVSVFDGRVHDGSDESIESRQKRKEAGKDKSDTGGSSDP